jgi:hypothetical protein
MKQLNSKIGCGLVYILFQCSVEVFCIAGEVWCMLLI